MIVFSTILYSLSLKASPKTYGYALTMPNEFWPDTPMPPILITRGKYGNEIQQKTAANNPDIFCKSQGSGYRLPSIGEFQSSAHSVMPGSNSQSQTPGHWSQYVNNDTTKKLIPDNNTRSTSGSLYNEWGDVSKYANGWEVGNYWSTELSAYNDNVRTLASAGRYQFVNNGGVVLNTAALGKSVLDTVTDVNTLKYVACVRDLVPTPSTPTPSKS